MSTIVTRIKEYLDYKGISNSAFEKSMGLSNAAFRNLLLKGGAIGSDKLENFITLYPEVSLSWLIKGEGEMLTESQPEESFVPQLKAEHKPVLSNTEILLRDLLAEKEAKIDTLQEIIWQLKEEIGSLKNQLEHKGGTAQHADGSSVANVG